MNSYYAYCIVEKTGVINLELERAISQDYCDSYCYANYILRGWFKLGEEKISQDPEFSFSYAFHVLKGRFRLGEKSIMKTPYGVNYLVKIMGYNHD